MTTILYTLTIRFTLVKTYICALAKGFFLSHTENQSLCTQQSKFMHTAIKISTHAEHSKEEKQFRWFDPRSRISLIPILKL